MRTPTEKPIDECSEAELNQRICAWMGLPVTEFRYWYSGHDNTKPYRYHDTKASAETSRKHDIKFGCGPVEEVTSRKLPNYAGSLDLMALAEARLTDEQFYVFRNHLIQQVELEIPFTKDCPAGSRFFQRDRAIHSRSARQRAIALLKTVEAQP